MKWLLNLSLLLVLQWNVHAQEQQIEQWIQSFVSGETMKHASVSITIKNEQGEKVGQYNSVNSLPTASTAKLFSTASAIEILGPDYKPKTRLYFDGQIDTSGILNGNIWIRGGGDPTLGSKYFNDKSEQDKFLKDWAKLISEKGIKQINGAIIADASEFGYVSAPDSWTWNDMGNYYGASPSGLTVFDNIIEYHFKTSANDGGSTTITELSPKISMLQVRNEVKAANIKYDNSYIYGAPYSNVRIATGTLPAGRSDFVVKGSLPDPELTVANLLYDELLEIGITTSEPAKAVRLLGDLKRDYSAMRLIHTEYGKSIKEITKLTNHKSINLFAEHLLCLIAYEKGDIGSVNNGVKYIQQFWKQKINTEGLYITDGSGLSRSNGISSEHLTSLLHYMNTRSANKDVFYKSLPVSGESGTLLSLCKSEKGHGRIHAKSGTMSRIKSYAGYIESVSGTKYTFAIIVNNFDGSATAVKKKMEPLLNNISGL